MHERVWQFNDEPNNKQQQFSSLILFYSALLVCTFSDANKFEIIIIIKKNSTGNSNLQYIKVPLCQSNTLSILLSWVFVSFLIFIC